MKLTVVLTLVVALIRIAGCVQSSENRTPEKSSGTISREQYAFIDQNCIPL